MLPFRYIGRSLFLRRGASVTAGLGAALVAVLLSGSLMLAKGVRETFELSARPSDALVLRAGSESENMSLLESTSSNVVLSSSEVARAPGGEPIGTAELLVNAALEKVGASGVANLQIRGVDGAVRSYRPEVQLVAGRWANPGAGEAVVGRSIVGRLRDLELGRSVSLRKNRPVTIVGVFSASGTAYESEMWTDRDLLQAAFGRVGSYSSIRVRLSGSFEKFKAAIEQDRRLGAQVLKESEYYAKHGSATAAFLTVLGSALCLFVAIAAVLGGTSTMQSSVVRRQREIGVLRALGFSKGSVLSAILLESVLLSIAGGLVGVLAALALGSVQFSMMNFTSWSEIVFRLRPSLSVLAAGIGGSVFVGVFAGLLPALRASRISPIDALKA